MLSIFRISSQWNPLRICKRFVRYLLPLRESLYWLVQAYLLVQVSYFLAPASGRSFNIYQFWQDCRHIEDQEAYGRSRLAFFWLCIPPCYSTNFLLGSTTVRYSRCIPTRSKPYLAVLSLSTRLVCIFYSLLPVLSLTSPPLFLLF